jgi:hypothetical protein
MEPEFRDGKRSLFQRFTDRRFFQSLSVVYESARDGPSSRFISSLNKDDPVVDLDYDVDGGERVFVVFDPGAA